MENNSKHSEKQAKRNTGATVCIGFIIAFLLVCFSIFFDSPSLAYIIVVYISFVLAALATLVAMLVQRKLKVYAGLICAGSAIGTFATVLNQDFHHKMLVGQLVTGIFVLLNILLIILIWRKQ